VTAVDVYHVTPRDIIADIRHLGARTLGAVPAEHFDLVVMPCHCPDEFLAPCTYDRRIYSSEAVKEFLNDRRFRIEITGVKGKTSTCYVLAHLLDAAGKRVFLHTSRGLGPYARGRHTLTEIMSITPVSLLELPKGDYDVMICEVSLGGSGKADIAGITNLLENYGIARKTRTAEEAKSYILTDKINVVPESEISIWSKYGKPLRGYGTRVKAVGKPVFGQSLKVSVDYRGTHEIELKGTYLALQYLDAMSMALEICDIMDIPAEAVLNGLSSFPGVPGRGAISEENGIRYLRDRNPGISHLSIERTLSCLQAMDALQDAVLIIDPVSKKVCDKMDKDLIGAVAAKHNVPLIITAGNGTEPEVPAGKKTVIRMIKEGYQ
ncbi:MAG: coenzyme F430 synthase, partial [Candidatus Methanomethylophilus sp.]|nr:coenzyme F430 synthase [Methanomethylophilus sp.]